MTRDDIIRMAREQGCPETATDGVFLVNADDLGRLIAAEREACAKTAEELIEATFQKPLTFNMIADAIRARGRA